MSSLIDAVMWSPEEALLELNRSLPNGWLFHVDVKASVPSAEVVDQDGTKQWGGHGLDLKVLYLDALGWLRLRDHKASRPIWRPRVSEVVVSPISEKSTTEDPPDLDPSEVASVYKRSR